MKEVKQNLTNEKQKTLIALKKAIGTLQKVQQMVEEDKYCIDIIQQIDASIGSLKSSKNILLKGHLDHCLEHKIKENKNLTIEELLKVYNISSK